MNLTEDLLTENRYWTFWTIDWTERTNVYWEGKTPFYKVIVAVKKHMKKRTLNYERQISIQNPDLKFD